MNSTSHSSHFPKPCKPRMTDSERAKVREVIAYYLFCYEATASKLAGLSPTEPTGNYAKQAEHYQARAAGLRHILACNREKYA